jgi:hypothetical protein
MSNGDPEAVEEQPPQISELSWNPTLIPQPYYNFSMIWLITWFRMVIISRAIKFTGRFLDMDKNLTF